ncbi:MAG TPA: alpha/beta fold hydrolase [Anaerolineales bacterium]|nr:alpha/beta fold hydrolase [Anaerolineales bacterium]
MSILRSHIDEIKSRANPVANYEEAVARVKTMQEADNQDSTRDVCITKLYEHGKQTEHVIILIHGFTNCPEQFTELGKQYYEAGNSVFIPRMPYHGLTDRLTDALVNLTAENLAAFGDQVIDIAHGLGKKVTVMGISGSGTLAAWLAQNRADIDFAFAIAPLFGLAFIPSSFTKLFQRIALLLPNFFLWWDPRTRADNPYSIYYAYPRYPTRALVEIIRLGMITRAQAEHFPPKAGNITMIINDAEPAVSNAEILKFLKLWQEHAGGNVSEYHFEKDMRLPHDIITPGTPGVPIGDIQPRLISAVRELHAK